MNSSSIYMLTNIQVIKLKELLVEREFEPKTVPYTQYAFTAPNLNITVYEKKNKLMVQGKKAAEFIEFVLEPEILGESMFEKKSEDFSPHFGIDESGKGDYFGPLVIAGVYVNERIASSLLKIGVCDSKLVSSSAKIRSIAAAIRKTPGIACQVVSIGPERYNELYASFNNLNNLLAWGHARVIEGLLEQVPDCPRALSDQFAHASVLKRALSQKKLKINLDQRTKAESDVAVGAASILARERFVNWMDETSEAAGVKLPLGASKQVIAAGKEFLRTHGDEMLGKVAKLHFKTTQSILPDLI